MLDIYRFSKIALGSSFQFPIQLRSTKQYSLICISDAILKYFLVPCLSISIANPQLKSPQKQEAKTEPPEAMGTQETQALTAIARPSSAKPNIRDDAHPEARDRSSGNQRDRPCSEDDSTAGCFFPYDAGYLERDCSEIAAMAPMVIKIVATGSACTNTWL